MEPIKDKLFVLVCNIIHHCLFLFNSLPDEEVLVCSKLEEFPDDKLNVTEIAENWFEKKKKKTLSEKNTGIWSFLKGIFINLNPSEIEFLTINIFLPINPFPSFYVSTVQVF